MNFPGVLQKIWDEIFLEYFKKPEMRNSSSASKAWVEYFLEWYKQVESMPDYNYLNIELGATPTGSADRAPDRNTNLKEFDKKGWRRRKFEPMIDYKYPTIASGATPIGSADRAPDRELLWEDDEWRTKKKIFKSIIGGTHWYVSNVSIIFDVPCLFLHHLLSVLLHFMAFLCIFRN
jgi:hypothetical protein